MFLRLTAYLAVPFGSSAGELAVKRQRSSSRNSQSEVLGGGGVVAAGLLYTLGSLASIFPPADESCLPGTLTTMVECKTAASVNAEPIPPFLPFVQRAGSAIEKNEMGDGWRREIRGNSADDDVRLWGCVYRIVSSRYIKCRFFASLDFAR